MNNINNIFNKNEIESKLKNFKEGQDYSVSPTDEPNIKTYTFHDDKLRSMFRGDRVPVRITREAYDGEDYTYRGHFEEGKDYRYSSQHWHFGDNYPVDPDGWKKISEWREEFGNNGDYIWGGIRGRRLGNEFEPRKIEPNSNDNEVEMHRKHLAEFQEKKHNLEMINIDEEQNPKSCCEEHTQAWLKNPNRQKLIEERKKDIKVLETKIQYEKDWLAKNANGSQQPDWIKCHVCGETFNKNTDSWGVKHIRDGSGFTPTCCSDCAKKYAHEIGGKWGRRNEFYSSDDYSNSDLRKENQELRQELSEVKNQLAQVLDELKKLKLDINGKGSEKLEQQIVKNEKLIKDSENISVAEVQEQVNKSQALMNEFNTTASSTKNDKGNGSLPHVIGGSVILASAGIIGYFLLKKNKRK